MAATLDWYPRAVFVSIFVWTIAGVALGSRSYAGGFDQTTGTIAFAVLLIVAVVETLTVRFLVLPALLQNPANVPAEKLAEQMTIVGYAFVMASAIFGLVISVVTGQGLLALPFGAIALVAYYIVHSYLTEALHSTRSGR